jgi:hypothetical protein
MIDQLDLGLFAVQLVADRLLDRGVDFAEATREETVGCAVGLVVLEIGGSGHQSLSCNMWES